MMDVKEVILSLPLILNVLEKNENSNILFVASEYKCLMSSFDEMSGFFFLNKNSTSMCCNCMFTCDWELEGYNYVRKSAHKC